MVIYVNKTDRYQANYIDYGLRLGSGTSIFILSKELLELS